MRGCRPHGKREGASRGLIALVSLIAFAAFAGFTAASAVATIWFAAPGGSGPDPCLVSDPCAIDDALSDAPSGSRIRALAGTYPLGAAGVTVNNGISLQGPWGGPPALFVGAGVAGTAITATGDDTRVTDLSVEQSGFGDGVEVKNGALADRVVSTTSGSGGACTPSIGGLVRDSLCIATGAGNGVVVEESSAVVGTATITNVTAISNGSGANAGALLVRAQGGADLDVEATNVIANAYGAAPDVVSGALAGSNGDLVLGSSNYATTAALAPGTVTPAGTNGNQTADPAFVDAGGGDYSEATDSPTIDAGSAAVPSLGLLDLIRVARIGGSAPDIGAYEYIPGPDTRPPNVFITSAPKGKIKTSARSIKATFELASDEPGVTFTCQLDRNPAGRCTSPVTYELAASRSFGTRYLLTVTATDAAGNRSGKAKRTVTVIRTKKH